MTIRGPRYRVLGPVAVRDSVDQGTPKQRAVLAVLLLNANQTVSERHIVAMVWGEHAPRSVLGRVRVYIHGLRALLGKDEIDRVNAGYRIKIAPGELDLDVFTGHVAQAHVHASAGRAADAATELRQALSLWKGSPLAGAGTSLADREGPALEERRLSALEELFDAELTAGRHGEIFSELRRVAADHPSRERLQGQLMLALDRSGRRSEARTGHCRT